ncbi:MAG TPA: hypothetical protein ENH82_19705 [bacterium]|nr:hypothetical protein [bacterium]
MEKPIKLPWMDKMRELEKRMDNGALSHFYAWDELMEYGIAEEKRITKEFAEKLDGKYGNSG